MALHVPHLHLEPTDSEHQGDLSYEQMRALLQRAENRMRAAVTAETLNDDVVHLQKLSRAEDNEDNQLLPKIPKLSAGTLTAPYVSTASGVAQVDARRLLKKSERDLSSTSRRVEGPVQLNEKMVKEKQATAGSNWFNLPKTKLTPDMKRDLQLLKMRGVLDPKRHYKKDNSKTLVPEFSQIGTIVEGPTEYFSSRVPNQERRRTFVEDVLTDERSTGRFKNKYKDIQTFKTSGKKAFYNKLKEKRRHGIHKQ